MPHLAGGQAQEPVHALAGHGEGVPAHRHQEDPEGAQRQGHVQDEARAHPGLEGHVHAAAQRFHLGAHHVQAHAPSGHVRHRLGGGQARHEDEAHVARVPQHGQPPLPGPHAHALQVHAPPVVLHHHLHPAAAQPGGEPHPALLGLAPLAPRRGRLGPVGHGVAHQVQERLAQALQERAVQLQRAALHLQPHLLARGARQVAHVALEARARLGEGQGARAPHLLVQAYAVNERMGYRAVERALDVQKVL